MKTTAINSCACPTAHFAASDAANAGTALMLALVMAFSLSWSRCEAAAQLYRWVDDQGNVHYTDKIPPSQAERGHTELSDDGVRMRTVAPAKTPEEIRRERELERLRAQQQRLIEQQQTADRALLSTFRTVDDLVMVRDGKMSAIDAQIQVTKGNARRQQDWLTRLRSEAADLERAGEPVTKQLEERISGTERSIKQSMAAVVQREQQKQEIRESFSRDLKRFLQLKDLPESSAERESLARTPMLENLVECNDRQECDLLWQRAQAYLKRYATLPIEITTDDVIVTAAPSTDAEVGLTVSRIWDKEQPGGLIFLDLQCSSYTSSIKICRTDDRLKILDGFRAALHSSATQAAR